MEEKMAELLKDGRKLHLVGGEANNLNGGTPPPCQATMSQDGMLHLLQRQLGEVMMQCHYIDQLAAKQIQETRQELEQEKSNVRDQLFQLEDLVRRMEQEMASSQDDRLELTRLSEDNAFLRNKAERLQQEIFSLDDANKKYRTKLEDLKMEIESLNCKLEELSKQNQVYEVEISQKELHHNETTDQLHLKLEEVTAQKNKANTTVDKLQETVSALEAENAHRQLTWQKEREQLAQELQTVKQENEKYWEELCHLNTQSLQLTNTLSDLTAQREGSYEAIQDMNARLQEAIEGKHQASTLAEQLQGQLSDLKKEGLQKQAEWQREKEQLDNEVLVSKQELLKAQNEMCQLTCTVSHLKSESEGGQEAIQQLENRLKELIQQKEEATATANRLQARLDALLQEKADWCWAKEQLEQELQSSKEKIQGMIVKHKQEKLDLLNGIDETNKQLLVMAALQDEVTLLKQTKQTLEEQCHSLTRLLKDATEKASHVEALKADLSQAQAEYQTLRGKLNQLQEELEVSKDQLLEANSKLSLAQSQHMREIQQWKEKLGTGENISHLQNRLAEEQQTVQQLQERLRFHAEQTNRQLAMQQEEHERLLRRMEERMMEVEMNLKNVRAMLQEKVDQLKEQLEKNTKSDLLLKDLYVENAQLMKALQVTEQRQKGAEKKNYLLEEKIAALNKVIKKIAPASLAV